MITYETAERLCRLWRHGVHDYLPGFTDLGHGFILSQDYLDYWVVNAKEDGFSPTYIGRVLDLKSNGGRIVLTLATDEDDYPASDDCVLTLTIAVVGA